MLESDTYESLARGLIETDEVCIDCGADDIARGLTPK